MDLAASHADDDAIESGDAPHAGPEHYKAGGPDDGDPSLRRMHILTPDLVKHGFSDTC